MALRELVEGDCGGSNSLVRLTSHFVQDHGLKDEGFLQDYPPNDSITNSSTEQLVQQFMEENIGQSAQPFRMDTLLAEMRELEGRRSHVGVVRSPSISQLAAQEDAQTWAQQYIDAGKVFQVKYIRR
ncbi:hypothetical protein AAG570_006166 [Ranatra chinensis]|uniref:Uncharacterized protein n=1 Tax=Ranatra chinensis TaxID=642074 RepID=A0ABD0XX95_9HEMI